MSDSVRPHRWQPTRLPLPWDSPGKNTGAGSHFLLQCMKGKRESDTTLSDPMDFSIPGSSIHGIFQARVLESVAIAFSESKATSCKMLGWWFTSRNQDCWEQYQQPQICRWHHPYGRNRRGLKSLLMNLKEESEKAGLKYSIQKNHGIRSHHFMANRWGKKWKQWQTVCLGSKITSDSYYSHKLKDTCSSEEKLWQTYTVY